MPELVNVLWFFVIHDTSSLVDDFRKCVELTNLNFVEKDSDDFWVEL